jgi:4-oxalocrotonate tautomerase family enzyme
MPLVRIEIRKGHTREYKKTFMQCVHNALVTAFGVPERDRYQRLYELDNDYFEFDNSKSHKFAIIELTIFPGRSADKKKTLIHEMTRLLGEKLEIDASDLFIVMHEPPLENWGLGGRQLSEKEK